MAKIEITHETDDETGKDLPVTEGGETKKPAKKTSAKKNAAKINVKYAADEPVPPPKTKPAKKIVITEDTQELPVGGTAEVESPDSGEQAEQTADAEPEAPAEQPEEHQRYVIQSLKPEEVAQASPEAIAAAAAAAEKTSKTQKVEAESSGEVDAVPVPPGAEEEQQDPELDKTVDEVAVADSDELLERSDADLESAFKPQEKLPFSKKLRHWAAVWWHNKWARNISIVTLLVIIAAAAAFPSSRYYILNMAGVRVSASLNVSDDKTLQPLKNVHVSIGGQSGVTDGEGKVSLSRLKLGTNDLVITKRAFADTTTKVTLGMGSNPLGEYKVTATGAAFAFVVTDWLSGKPVSGAEATSGEANAKADKNGKITLVIDADQSDNPVIVIQSASYRSEKITVAGSDRTIRQVKMVPDHKHLFVSKRSGKLDVYKIDADGKNEQLLLAGTGNERDDMVLVTSPNAKAAAVVSTRENQHNKDGFVVSGLFVIDVNTGEVTKLAQSERVQIVDWIGDKLVYVLVAEGASGSNPKRHRLISYDYKTEDKKELAASNYFNDVLAVSGKIYYAPSNAYLENPSAAKLFVVNPDGTSLQTILNRETWNVFRTDYNQLYIAAQQDWYTYKIGDASSVKAAGGPAQQKSRLFVDSDDRSHALWSEDRDGKGTLLLRDTLSGKDKVLESRPGLKAPVYWLSGSYVVYRVSTSSETADYVISTQGGGAQKIRDVSNIAGIDSWYFY